MNATTLPDTLEVQTCRDLSAKGHLGAIMYTLIWLLVMFVSPITQDWPVVSYTVLGLLAGTGLIRGYFGLRFESIYLHSPRIWFYVYCFSVFGTAITIGSAAGFTLWFYTLEMTGYLVTFALGGLVAGGTVSLITHSNLQRVFIFIMLMPVSIVCVFLGDPVALTLGAIFVFDILYLSVVGKRQSEEYWSALHANRKLSERAIELEEARKKAEALDRAKSDFLSQINHELRTPLSSIIGYARLLNRSTSLSNDDQEKVDIITRSGGYLLKLINDVLEISKIEAGEASISNTHFDLNSMLNEIIEMMSIVASEKNLTLYCDVDTDVPKFIEGDELKLRQIIINLVNNAIKFTNNGHVSLSVTLAKTRDASNANRKQPPLTLQFSVTDSGIGVPEVDRQNIFNLFTQSNSGNFQEGTGLGLAISNKFVEMLGGKMNLTSEVGKGSCFSFTMHTTEVAAPDYSYESVPINPCGYESNEDISVLIADDNVMIRNLIVSILQPIGFNINVVKNGLEAVEYCQKNTSSIVLMDLMMPELDGYDAVKQIRKLPGHASTPIIACTADSFTEAKQKAIKAGFNDVLKKPFEESDVLSMIKAHTPIEYRYAK